MPTACVQQTGSLIMEATMLTDIPHRPVRRVRLVRVQRECEEAAVRAFAPLQVGVHGDIANRDVVRTLWRHPSAERGARCNRSPGKLDADRTVAGDGVIAGLERAVRACARGYGRLEGDERDGLVRVWRNHRSANCKTRQRQVERVHSRARSLTQFACESPERMSVLSILFWYRWSRTLLRLER